MTRPVTETHAARCAPSWALKGSPYCLRDKEVCADCQQTGFPEPIDVHALVELLGVGERYVRRVVAERQVPTVKLGRLVRFDLAEIRRWLDEQRRPRQGR